MKTLLANHLWGLQPKFAVHMLSNEVQQVSGQQDML
jgi:hypothetical protein